MTVFWNVALKMEALSLLTSPHSFNKPEDQHRHLPRENLKPHKQLQVLTDGRVRLSVCLSDVFGKNPVFKTHLWDFKFSRRRAWSSESSGMDCRVLNWMSTDVSEVRAASLIRSMIILMMEAARTSETLVDIQFRTRQYIPEDSEL
jgi:hypothetical protein